MDKKQKTEEFHDDGHTIADMTVDGMQRDYSQGDSKFRKKKKEFASMNLTKKESRAMIRGAFAALLPMFVVIILCFTFVFLLLKLWLS